MGFLRVVCGVLITIGLASLAVMNRERVPFLWSPVHDPVILPLYLIMLGAVGFGFLFGGMVVWLNMGPLRQKKRDQKQEIKTLETKIETLQKQAGATLKAPASEFFLALPPKP